MKNIRLFIESNKLDMLKAFSDDSYLYNYIFYLPFVFYLVFQGAYAPQNSMLNFAIELPVFFCSPCYIKCRIKGP